MFGHRPRRPLASRAAASLAVADNGSGSASTRRSPFERKRIGFRHAVIFRSWCGRRANRIASCPTRSGARQLRASPHAGRSGSERLSKVSRQLAGIAGLILSRGYVRADAASSPTSGVFAFYDGDTLTLPRRAPHTPGPDRYARARPRLGGSFRRPPAVSARDAALSSWPTTWDVCGVPKTATRHRAAG
jgi:hypothetical protein